MEKIFNWWNRCGIIRPVKMDGLVAAVISRVFILSLLIREMRTGSISVLVVQVFLKRKTAPKHGISAIKVCGQISYLILMQKPVMIRIFLLRLIQILIYYGSKIIAVFFVPQMLR